MRTVEYIGVRKEGTLRVRVEAAAEDGQADGRGGRGGYTRDLPPRLDLMNHSPTGFECGYSGSGPAQLALAILAHFFEESPEDIPAWTLQGSEDDVNRRDGERAAIRLHQHFKGARIGRLPSDTTWTITSGEIREWVAARRPGIGDAPVTP